MEEVRWVGGCHLLFIGLLHISHLPQGHSSPTWNNLYPMATALHEVALLRYNLLDAATCRPFLFRTSTRVLRPKPTKPAASSVLIRSSTTWHVSLSSSIGRPTKSFWASLDSHVRRLDLVNTVTPMYTCAHRCPRCQPLRLVTRPPGLSVQASRPLFIALGPSVWHVSTWPSLRRRPPPLSSTPAHHEQRDMLHDPTRVSHQLNLDRGSCWQSLIINQTTRAHLNLVFATNIS